MEYRDERARLYDILVAEGLGPKEAAEVNIPVPQRYKDLWIKRFYAKQESLEFPKDPRLVNRFTVGADPEFFFINKMGYLHAENLGLTTLKAFGCDLAGRQAELRVAPSRFAIDLVASVAETLRWMAALVEETRAVNWVSKPYMDNGGRGDGAGGHIHLARKHVTLKAQIKSLDHATSLCLGTGIFDADAFKQRSVATVYGKWGDYRPQPFGFEYRTAPTWLSSPLIAYLAIVIHKLASHHHLTIIPKDGKARVQHQVLNLFRLYRGLDDDAALALRAIQELGWPVDDPSDFKPRWGVANAAYHMSEKTYVPTVIDGSDATKRQLFEVFNGTTKMKLTPPECTWVPKILPKGCHSVSVSPHMKDLPDFAMGLMSYKHSILIGHNGVGRNLMIYTPIDLDGHAIQTALKGFGVDKVHIERQPRGQTLTIYIPEGTRSMNPEERKAYRDALANPAILPLCRVSQYVDGIFDRWDAPLVKPVIKTIGKKIGEVVPDLPPVDDRAPDPIRVGPAGFIARPPRPRYGDVLAQQAQVMGMGAAENRLMAQVQQQPADPVRVEPDQVPKPRMNVWRQQRVNAMGMPVVPEVRRNHPEVPEVRPAGIAPRDVWMFDEDGGI